MRIRFALLVAVLLGISGIAFGFPSMMMVGGGSGSAPLATQATTALSPASCTYPFGSASGTLVCNMAATMSPPTPAFSGTFSGSTAQFAVNSATGAITLAENDQCSSSPCNYSLPVTATPSNPTIAPFTQTITITSSSGPSVPAAANAGCLTSNGGGPTNGSCFNTLALSMDFTTSGAVSGFSNGVKFNAQNTANWLYCSGQTPTNAVADITAGNGSSLSSSTLAPCSAATIVNDGGTSVLQELITPTDVSNGAGSWTISFNDTRGANVGTPIPGQFYAEIKWRLPPSSYVPSGNPITNDYWTYTGGTATPCMEWDFAEFYGNSDDYGGTNSCDGSYQGVHDWNLAPNYNKTVYQIFGERVTSDGTGNAIQCFYLNNVQYNMTSNLQSAVQDANCINANDSTRVSNFETALSVLLQIGQESLAALNANLYDYIQWLHVYSCSNWVNATRGTGSGPTGGQCVGVALATNP